MKQEVEVPDTIFLQFYGDSECVDNIEEISIKDVTWSEEEIYPTDVEYTRRKSPWKSVKEKLPKENELVLCRMVSNGAIVSGYIYVESGKPPRVATNGDFEFEDYGDYECDIYICLSPLSMKFLKRTRMRWN